MEKKLVEQLYQELSQFTDKVRLLIQSYEKKTKEYDALVSAYAAMNGNSREIIADYKETISELEQQIQQLQNGVLAMTKDLPKPGSKTLEPILK